jgi:hypothetical protein
MDSETLAQLREGAMAYYDQYLSPAAAIQRLLMAGNKKISLNLLPFLKTGGGFA